MQVDRIQQRLVSYASSVTYSVLPPETVRAVKVRIIDTFGAMLGGFDGQPCVVARALAARAAVADGATIIGTAAKATLDMAAFVNGTTARYAELNDIYQGPGRPGGHPSDVVLPTYSAAEYAHRDGRALITATVLAYEVYARMTDAVDIPGFDYTNLVCLAAAIANGRLLGLSESQLADCIAMAVIPNNALLQGRKGQLSMWKVMASGQAARAGAFAAMLARDGAQGPTLPFEGKEGWCRRVAGKSFELGEMGGEGARFKVHDTLIKPRPARYITVPAILAAERVAPLEDSEAVAEVEVETFKRAARGVEESHWRPRSREMADHSLPFVVAAALLEGRVTPNSFDDDRILAPATRELMSRIRIVENEDFTRAHETLGLHHTRVIVHKRDGSKAIGEFGGDHGDLSHPVTDAQVTEKFRSLAEPRLGARKTDEVLDLLWNLEGMSDVESVAAALVLQA